MDKTYSNIEYIFIEVLLNSRIKIASKQLRQKGRNEQIYSGEILERTVYSFLHNTKYILSAYPEQSIQQIVIWLRVSGSKTFQKNEFIREFISTVSRHLVHKSSPSRTRMNPHSGTRRNNPPPLYETLATSPSQKNSSRIHPFARS